jgi:hypothetical protein
MCLFSTSFDPPAHPFVNSSISPSISIKCGEFLTSLWNIRFSWRTHVRGVRPFCDINAVPFIVQTQTRLFNIDSRKYAGCHSDQWQMRGNKCALKALIGDALEAEEITIPGGRTATKGRWHSLERPLRTQERWKSHRHSCCHLAANCYVNNTRSVFYAWVLWRGIIQLLYSYGLFVMIRPA